MSFVLCALVACGGRDGESGYVVEQAAWGYSGPNGPEQWASLAPENAPCAEGVQQSPVDLTAYERASAPALSFSYGAGVSEACARERLHRRLIRPSQQPHVGRTPL